MQSITIISKKINECRTINLCKGIREDDRNRIDKRSTYLLIIYQFLFIFFALGTRIMRIII